MERELFRAFSQSAQKWSGSMPEMQQYFFIIGMRKNIGRLEGTQETHIWNITMLSEKSELHKISCLKENIGETETSLTCLRQSRLLQQWETQTSTWNNGDHAHPPHPPSTTTSPSLRRNSCVNFRVQSITGQEWRKMHSHMCPSAIALSRDYISECFLGRPAKEKLLQVCAADDSLPLRAVV